MKSNRWRLAVAILAAIAVVPALVYAAAVGPDQVRPTAVVMTDGNGTFSPDPAPITTFVEATIAVKATRPVPTPPTTVGAPTWIWSRVWIERRGGGTGRWTIYSGSDAAYWVSAGPNSSSAGGSDYSTATIKASFPKGGYWRIIYEAKVTYTASNGGSYKGTAEAIGKETAVEVELLRLVSGAKRIDAHNFATVCNGSGADHGKAVVEAIINPDTDAAAAAVTWAGDGTVVSGKPRQRSVDVYTSVKRTVKATAGTSSDSLTVWPIWATVGVTVAGPAPANTTFPAPYNAGGQLGVWYNDIKSEAAGKMVTTATLTPTGVGAVVKTGFDMKRQVWIHYFKDGARFPRYYYSDWEDDTSFSAYKITVPDAADKLYDWDAPECRRGGATNSVEANFNARQYVTWDGVACSYKTDGSAAWYWQARWKRTATPQIVSAAVAGGNLDLSLYTTPLR